MTNTDFKEQEINAENTEISEGPKTDILDSEETSANRKLTRKERLAKKIRDKYLNPIDIKYVGPLSYRYLRIIAWICFAIGQIVVFDTICNKLFHEQILSMAPNTVISMASGLTMPLFAIASFGLVLSGRRTHFKILTLYGLAFVGVGIGINLFYYRYIDGLMKIFGFDETSIAFINGLFGKRLDINVFVDLFLFSLFNFFIIYTPKRFFEGKKVILFRLMSLIPIAYVIVSYIFKVGGEVMKINLPFALYPFMATKSPLLFALFASVSLWIKNRERTFLKLGFSREDYNGFLMTRRNSLYYSIHFSGIVILFAVLELIAATGLIVFYVGITGMSFAEFIDVSAVYGIGQCLSMIGAIPIIFLYSYTKYHKQTLIDIFIPICGVAVVVLEYIEGAHQLIANMVGSIN